MRYFCSGTFFLRKNPFIFFSGDLIFFSMPSLVSVLGLPVLFLYLVLGVDGAAVASC